MAPTELHLRGGVTLQTIAAAGSTQADAAPIVRQAATTIVIVEGGQNAVAGGPPTPGVILPADAEIGDLVEFHMAGTPGGAATVMVYPDVGSKFTLTWTTNGPLGTIKNFSIRKVADGVWDPIGSYEYP